MSHSRSLVRRANRHRMSSGITAPDRSIEKRIRELKIRIKLLETRTTENKKRAIKLLRDGGFRVSSRGCYKRDSFLLMHRGCYKRDSFLLMHGLFPRFKLLMKTDNNVCVNSCQIYLQDVVIKEDLVDELTKFGLIYPLQRSTVHG